MIPPQAWCEFWDEKWLLLHQCYSRQGSRAKDAQDVKLHEKCPDGKHLQKIKREYFPDATESEGHMAVAKTRGCVRRTWTFFSKPSLDPSDFMRPYPEDVFTIYRVEGRGRGMIANRDLAYGEIVLKEPPLIMMPAKYSVSRMLALLPRKAYESILLLHNEKSEFFDLYTEENEKEDVIRIFMNYLMGIWETNAFAVENYHDISVLLLKGSLFNHSDRPNVMRSWDPNTDEMAFITCEDIKKGEELLIDYAPDGWGIGGPPD